MVSLHGWGRKDLNTLLWLRVASKKATRCPRSISQGPPICLRSRVSPITDLVVYEKPRLVEDSVTSQACFIVLDFPQLAGATEDGPLKHCFVLVNKNFIWLFYFGYPPSQRYTSATVLSCRDWAVLILYLLTLLISVGFPMTVKESSQVSLTSIV